MLVHRLRRWPNIKSTLAQRLVSAGALVSCAESEVRPWGGEVARGGITCVQGWQLSSQHPLTLKGRGPPRKHETSANVGTMLGQRRRR